jgi:hypothetical protein
MKAWIGKSLLVIGALHSIFGFVVFRGVLGDLVREGLFNTVNIQADRNAAFWFLFGGFTLMIIGGLVDWAERKKIALPPFLTWSFLVLTAAGCVIMPRSGFWMLFVPIAGLLYRARKAGRA